MNNVLKLFRKMSTRLALPVALALTLTSGVTAADDYDNSTGSNNYDDQSSYSERGEDDDNGEGCKKHGKRGKPDHTEMFEHLQLTDEQQTEVSQLMQKHHEERRSASREAHEGMREQHQAEMAELLTPEQMETFESLLEERRPHRH